MSDVPDDIEIAARSLNMKLHSATELGQRTQWIAEALLAERDRCAKIAESRGDTAVGNNIAKTIRRR